MTETDTKSKRQLHKISHEKTKAQAHTKTPTGVDKNAKCRPTPKRQNASPPQKHKWEMKHLRLTTLVEDERATNAAGRGEVVVKDQSSNGGMMRNHDEEPNNPCWNEKSRAWRRMEGYHLPRCPCSPDF
jgi:hypothetical protein